MQKPIQLQGLESRDYRTGLVAEQSARDLLPEEKNSSLTNFTHSKVKDLPESFRGGTEATAPLLVTGSRKGIIWAFGAQAAGFSISTKSYPVVVG